MGRIKRADRDYDMLSSSLCALKYKELLNFFSVIGEFHFYEMKIFKDGVWNDFSKKGKSLAVKLEVERKINYKEYREAFSELIQEYTKEELHDKLILFVREVYGEKDEDVLYEKAKKIFLN